MRLHRRTLILFKSELTPTVDAAPVAGNGVPFISADFEADIATVDRDIVRQYFGASDALAGRQLSKLQLTHEIQGSGTSGAAPNWSDLIQAQGFAEAILATPARVEYTPISTDVKTGTTYVYADGILQKGLGMAGSGSLEMVVGTTPRLVTDFLGLYGGESVASLAAPAFTGWKAPVVVSKVNVSDVNFGGTYAAGVVTGGSSFPSRGLKINFGNDVQYIEMASSDYVALTNRKVTGQVIIDVTPAQEVANLALIKAATTQKMSFQVGTVAGFKVMVYGPAVQLTNPTVVNIQGVRMVQYDLTFQPTSAGNDELRIILL